MFAFGSLGLTHKETINDSSIFLYPRLMLLVGNALDGTRMLHTYVSDKCGSEHHLSIKQSTPLIFSRMRVSLPPFSSMSTFETPLLVASTLLMLNMGSTSTDSLYVRRMASTAEMHVAIAVMTNAVSSISSLLCELLNLTLTFSHKRGYGFVRSTK